MVLSHVPSSSVVTDSTSQAYVPLPKVAVRPIGVGEMTLRAFEAYRNSALLTVLPSIVGATQFGIGVPGGSEVVIHLMQVHLESGAFGHTAADPCCVAKTDVKAAFQTVSCQYLERHSNSAVVNV